MKFRLLIFDKKILWVLVATIFLSVFVSAGVDFAAFRETVKKNSAAISIMIGEGDELAIQNLVDELQRNFERQIEVHILDEGLIKTHIYNTGACISNYDRRIFNMGAVVGSLSACIKPQSLFSRGLKSRFFFLTFSLVQFFGLLYLVFTKSATERNLMSLIKYLETDQNKSEYLGRKSALFLKIEELIESREVANKKAAQSLISYEKEKGLADLAKQVAHDIRSPLMALEIALRDAPGLASERRELLEQASSRISSIAENLLSRSRCAKSVVFVPPIGEISNKALMDYNFLIAPSIEKIIKEKSVTFPNIFFESSGLDQSLSARGTGCDFERIISNLLQNAIEAVESVQDPKVQVAVRSYSSKIQIMIIDNGKGISSDVISRVGVEGFSHGKARGNGLGVSFAKKKVKEWDGDLQISSRQGSGTIISISLQLR